MQQQASHLWAIGLSSGRVQRRVLLLFHQCCVGQLHPRGLQVSDLMGRPGNFTNHFGQSPTNLKKQQTNEQAFTTISMKKNKQF